MMDAEEYRKYKAEYQKEYIDRDRDAYNAKRREYMRGYRKKNAEKMREYQREYHRVTGCSKKYGELHPEWKETSKARMRVKRAEERRIVIEAYGGKCEMCGISELQFLTIDHGFSDGKEHRERTYGKIYHDIIKNGFPKDRGYRVLCYNHNCSMKDKW